MNSERVCLVAAWESPKPSSTKTVESVSASYCECCRKAYGVQRDGCIGTFLLLELPLLVWWPSWFYPGFNQSFSVSLRALSYLKGHSTTYAALQVDGRRRADSQGSLILRFSPKDDGDVEQPWVLALLPPHEGCERRSFWSYKAAHLVQCSWPGIRIPRLSKGFFLQSWWKGTKKSKIRRSIQPSVNEVPKEVCIFTAEIVKAP